MRSALGVPQGCHWWVSHLFISDGPVMSRQPKLEPDMISSIFAVSRRKSGHRQPCAPIDDDPDLVVAQIGALAFARHLRRTCNVPPSNFDLARAVIANADAAGIVHRVSTRSGDAGRRDMDRKRRVVSRQGTFGVLRAARFKL